MKTVTVKGKVYQTGGMYYFYGLTRTGGEISILLYANDNGFQTYDNTWENCVVLDQKVGTITDAPIELEDGEMYSFEFDATRCMGFFNEAHQAFVNCGTFLCFLNEAIMIAPLMERT